MPLAPLPPLAPLRPLQPPSKLLPYVISLVSSLSPPCLNQSACFRFQKGQEGTECCTPLVHSVRQIDENRMTSSSSLDTYELTYPCQAQITKLKTPQGCLLHLITEASHHINSCNQLKDEDEHPLPPTFSSAQDTSRDTKKLLYLVILEQLRR